MRFEAVGKEYCRGCNRLLLEWSNLDDDFEGDNMYIIPLNDGQGGEAAYCPECYKAGKHLTQSSKPTTHENLDRYVQDANLFK